MSLFDEFEPLSCASEEFLRMNSSKRSVDKKNAEQISKDKFSSDLESFIIEKRSVKDIINKIHILMFGSFDEYLYFLDEFNYISHSDIYYRKNLEDLYVALHDFIMFDDLKIINFINSEKYAILKQKLKNRHLCQFDVLVNELNHIALSGFEAHRLKYLNKKELQKKMEEIKKMKEKKNESDALEIIICSLNRVTEDCPLSSESSSNILQYLQSLKNKKEQSIRMNLQERSVDNESFSSFQQHRIVGIVDIRKW